MRVSVGAPAVDGDYAYYLNLFIISLCGIEIMGRAEGLLFEGLGLLEEPF